MIWNIGWILIVLWALANIFFGPSLKFSVDKLNAFSTAIVALATVVNLIVSYYLWTATNNQYKQSINAFNVTQRPYISASTLVKDDPVKQELQFNGFFENVGPIPAFNFKPKWDVFINGQPQQITKVVNDGPSIVFPGRNAKMPAVINGQSYVEIMSGKKVLKLIISADYSGAQSEQFHVRGEYQYYPNLSDFFTISKEGN